MHLLPYTMWQRFIIRRRNGREGKHYEYLIKTDYENKAENMVQNIDDICLRKE